MSLNRELLAEWPTILPPRQQIAIVTFDPNLLKYAPAPGPSQVVPEPTTSSLLILCGAALIRRRRKT
ncbi:MAG: PEP-CTERM sorting domain-containing protein [Phycisphaerae bacterium]|jgi:hypothetical protein|nr:PEP-CTERM sorting domain-containing protein [Phycisphaerae bacterium]